MHVSSQKVCVFLVPTLPPLSFRHESIHVRPQVFGHDLRDRLVDDNWGVVFLLDFCGDGIVFVLTVDVCPGVSWIFQDSVQRFLEEMRALGFDNGQILSLLQKQVDKGENTNGADER